MKIYDGIAAFRKLKFAVVTSGTFDGVHTGHQTVLKRVIETARKEKGESVLLTFWPHPRLVLNNDKTFLKLINSIREKETILNELGIQHFIKIPFTREFAQMSSERFIRDILVDKIGTKKLVIGYNHRFGRNREGSFENLMHKSYDYGFEVEEIPRQEVDNIGISSSLIRKALHDGDVESASRFLGRPYLLNGTVIHGDKLGRILGFPTANIQVQEEYKLIPGNGTYAVWVKVENGTYRGMLNIGIRPTLNGNQQRIEVHILDFENEIYNSDLAVTFVKRLRDEKKFDSLDALKNQLETDKSNVIKILSL